MTAPRLGQGMPANDGWIGQQFANLQRQIAELRAARTLDASTISPGGTLTVEGKLDVTGDTVIGGTLSLPDGIIDDPALAKPVEPAVANAVQAGFTLTATATDYASVSVPVPPGFSTAQVTAIATVGASTSSGSSDLYALCNVNGVLGDEIAALCATGGAMSVTAPFATILTGLSGSFSLAARCRANVPANLASGQSNARISASVTFLR